MNVLDRVGMLDLAIRAQRFVPLPFVRIVGYHRIGDPKVVAREVDEGVVDVTAAAFERHVALLAERFNVIGVDRLRRYFANGEPLPKNPAMITFDDGYRECFDVALPILKRHGVPGVFFISTEHARERRVFWWDRIAYLFKRSTKARVEIDYPEPAVWNLDRDREGALQAALSFVKKTFALDLERYLEGLARALDVPWTTEEEKRLAEQSLTRWEDLREMRRAGMDIQSHTATHRVLYTLPDDDLARELTESKRTLEEALDEEIIAIAYPNGGSIGGQTKIGRAVRAAGYELGFSGTGVCRLGSKLDPLDLQRISVDIDLPDAYWRACVALPYAGV